jgi:4-methylaminobutanoate oxidase (formaldehyde-forming)
LPDHAQAVIVGGGIIGVSVVYRRDVVLPEQGSLSGGTTWHAAGLIGQLRVSSNFTRLIRYSADLYSRLEAETGQATGWKRCGRRRLRCRSCATGAGSGP